MTVQSTLFNRSLLYYDHQDILLHKIVFQIRDGLAIVESFVGEYLSIREKPFSRREGTFLRETLHSVRLEAWLFDHYWKRQILERQEFFPRGNRGSQGCTYTKQMAAGGQLLQLRPKMIPVRSDTGPSTGGVGGLFWEVQTTAGFGVHQNFVYGLACLAR